MNTRTCKDFVINRTLVLASSLMTLTAIVLTIKGLA